MAVKRYFLRKAKVDNNRMLDGRTGSADELLDIKLYIQQVVDEHVTIDEGILSSDAVLTLTGATGVVATATTGDVDIASTAGEVDIDAGTSVDIDATTTAAFTGGTGVTIGATTNDVDIISTAGDVDINAGANVEIDSTGTTTIIGATGAVLSATANDAEVEASAGTVILDASTGVDVRQSTLTFGGATYAFMLDETGYADDSAAGTGGVAVGQLYFNTTNSCVHVRMT